MDASRLVLLWLRTHPALVAAVLYAASLAVERRYQEALGVFLAALSGGVRPLPGPDGPPYPDPGGPDGVEVVK